MSLRCYIPGAAETVPVTADPVAQWNDVSILARALCATAPRGLAMTTVQFTSTTSSIRNILFFQFFSEELEPNQIIHGGQTIKVQCRAQGPGGANWPVLLAFGLRVWNDGTDPKQRKVIAVVAAGATDADPDALVNRSLILTSQSGDYTTIAGDRLVGEIGLKQYPG